MDFDVDARAESWPLSQPFSISRGSKTTAEVVVAAIGDGVHVGRGECVPYARYGETVAGVLASIRQARFADRHDLQTALPPGAARNALDCALWDLEAKQGLGRPHERADYPKLKAVLTAFTISLSTPAAMATAAMAVPHLPLLKLKLGGEGDAERMKAVREARPDARLIVDANEAWTPRLLLELIGVAEDVGVEVIEQPLPAGADQALDGMTSRIAICADESVHTASDVAQLRHRYQAVNIKLDKAGGLTAARALLREARGAGMKIMLGSMVSTSLAIAPAIILAQDADWVDLDGPLLLSRDRTPGISISNGTIQPPSPALWG